MQKHCLVSMLPMLLNFALFIRFRTLRFKNRKQNYAVVEKSG